jgi:hypothetical protein
MPHAKRVVSSPRQSSSMSYYTTWYHTMLLLLWLLIIMYINLIPIVDGDDTDFSQNQDPVDSWFQRDTPHKESTCVPNTETSKKQPTQSRQDKHFTHQPSCDKMLSQVDIP